MNHVHRILSACGHCFDYVYLHSGADQLLMLSPLVSASESVMSKMLFKGYLSRNQERHPFCYLPSEIHQSFWSNRLEKVIRDHNLLVDIVKIPTAV